MPLEMRNADAVRMSAGPWHSGARIRTANAADSHRCDTRNDVVHGRQLARLLQVTQETLPVVLSDVVRHERVWLGLRSRRYDHKAFLEGIAHRAGYARGERRVR